MKKLLIFGSEGMLGSELCEILSQDFNIFSFSKQIIDISIYDDVMDAFETHHPDIVINAAAYTDVDGCELDPDRCLDANAYGPKNLARACFKFGASLVQISSNAVFGAYDEEAEHAEEDMPRSTNFYGSCKIKGEDFIRMYLDDHWIIRTSWLYGQDGTNFLSTLQAADKPVSAISDEYGQPTDVNYLANRILQIVKDEKPFGTYHITGDKKCSWYEFVCEQIGKENVIAISSESLKRPARRPKYSYLRNTSL